MKKTILLFINTAIVLAGMAQGIYNTGAHIVSQSGSYLVLSQGNFTLTSQNDTYPASFANLKIEAGASLIIEPKSFLTVSGTLTNSAGNGGLVISSGSEGTGSLIHSTPNVPATLNRYITGSAILTAMKFHFLSVPLTPPTASFSALFSGSYLYDFDVANNSWNGLGTSTTAEMDETRGYMIYSPQVSHTFKFEGPMNAGTFSPLVTAEGEGNNLVPNPYPSAIDWDATGWTKTNIAASVYVWPSGGSNYASYVGSTSNNGGSNIIPAGQAFIVRATATPTFIMTDAVRVHNSQSFFKANETVTDLLRVKATSNSMTDEAVVRFTEMATTNTDSDYDAWKLYGTDGAPQLYTLATDNEMLAINSLPTLNGYAKVPMNFEANFAGNVTLSFSELESFPGTLSIKLEDKLTGQKINLRQQPSYTFAHLATNAKDRFILHFGSATGIDEPQTTDGNIWIFEKSVNISSPASVGEKALVEIFNAAGQVVFSKQITLSQPTQVPTNLSGFAVVRISTDKNVWITKGIF